jgi:predicted DNA-binding transcriptional regulator AlpA
MKSIFLSKKEVARKLNKSPSTVFRWAKDGIIPPPSKTGAKYNMLG